MERHSNKISFSATLRRTCASSLTFKSVPAPLLSDTRKMIRSRDQDQWITTFHLNNVVRQLIQTRPDKNRHVCQWIAEQLRFQCGTCLRLNVAYRTVQTKAVDSFSNKYRQQIKENRISQQSKKLNEWSELIRLCRTAVVMGKSNLISCCKSVQFSNILNIHAIYWWQ